MRLAKNETEPDTTRVQVERTRIELRGLLGAGRESTERRRALLADQLPVIRCALCMAKAGVVEGRILYAVLGLEGDPGPGSRRCARRGGCSASRPLRSPSSRPSTSRPRGSGRRASATIQRHSLASAFCSCIQIWILI